VTDRKPEARKKKLPELNTPNPKPGTRKATARNPTLRKPETRDPIPGIAS
jgi:hypothetical protein